MANKYFDHDSVSQMVKVAQVDFFFFDVSLGGFNRCLRGIMI